jgi:hypothetical protein
MRLQKTKQEWQKSPAGARQTVGRNLVWFGEIERKLAKLSKTTFTVLTVLPLNYFMVQAKPRLNLPRPGKKIQY